MMLLLGPRTRQRIVVKETGIPALNLSNLVGGKYKSLTIDTARKLAEYFGCAIEESSPRERQWREAFTRAASEA
jgi:hypothetical protein